MITLSLKAKLRTIAALVIFSITSQPLLVLAATHQVIIPPIPVQHSTEQLLDNGCHEVPVGATQQISSAQDRGWSSYIPNDALGEMIIMCPQNVSVQKVGSSEGQVAGITDELFPTAEAFVCGGICIGAGVLSLLGLGVAGGLAASSTARLMAAKALDSAGNTIKESLIIALNAILSSIADAANWLRYMLLSFLLPLITVGTFINHKAVTDFWPLVLGVVNLGFLLALLAIALFTTLRLDIGGGVRRLLPRLLIAALLVNFSLIIGGVMIDFSRLIMAVMTDLYLDGGLNQLPKAMEEAIHYEEAQVALLTGGMASSGDFAQVGIKGVEAVLSWFLLFAVAYLVISFVIRYVMLIILLVVSPIAYLTAIFPNTSSISKKWWSTFLRHVAYGPIALFLVLLAVNTSNTTLAEFLPGLASVDSRELIQVVALIVTGVMFFMAAIAGRWAGVAGSVAAINIANRTAQRTRGAIVRGGVGAARGTAKGAYVGSGARAASRLARNQTRDFAKTAKGNAANILGLAKRDKKGNLKKGQSSTGSRLANKLTFGGLSDQQRKERRDQIGYVKRDRSKKITDAKGVIGQANRLKDATSDTAKNTATKDPNLAPTNLRESHVLQALQKNDAIGKGKQGHIGRIIRHSSDQSQLKAILSNKDLMKSLNTDQRNQIAVEIRGNANFDEINDRTGKIDNEKDVAKIKADLLNEFHKTIDEADKDSSGLA